MHSTILITDRLFFKPLQWSDLDDIHRLNSSREVARYNTIGIPKDLDATKHVMAQVLRQSDEDGLHNNYAWCAYELNSDAFIGEVGMSLAPPRFRKASIFYNLFPEYWSQGYGREAALFLLRYGFEELKLHRMEAGVAIENTASIALLEKIGMHREGRGIKILPIDGNWKDNYSYAILEEKYFKDIK